MVVQDNSLIEQPMASNQEIRSTSGSTPPPRNSDARKRRSIFSKWFHGSLSSRRRRREKEMEKEKNKEIESNVKAKVNKKKKEKREPDADSYEIELSEKLACREFRARVEAPGSQAEEAQFRFDDEEDEISISSNLDSEIHQLNCHTHRDSDLYSLTDDDDDKGDSRRCSRGVSQGRLRDSPFVWHNSGLHFEQREKERDHHSSSPNKLNRNNSIKEGNKDQMTQIEGMPVTPSQLKEEDLHDCWPAPIKEDQGAGGQEMASYLSTSTDLLACSQMRAIELRGPKKAPKKGVGVSHPKPRGPLLDNGLYERDLRLINWRRLAGARKRRNAHPKHHKHDHDQHHQLTNNHLKYSVEDDEHDDSDLSLNNSDDFSLDDEEDSQSQAFVISCSDDTSCSSVELVWTRRMDEEPKRHKIIMIEADGEGERAILKESGSLSRLDSINDKKERENYDKGERNKSALESKGPAGQGAKINSASQLDSPPPKRGVGLLRRFSVFELAKPSRARARRQRVASPSLATGLLEDQQRNLSSAAQGSRSPSAPPVDWTPNPIFSMNDTNNNELGLRHIDDDDEPDEYDKCETQSQDHASKSSPGFKIEEESIECKEIDVIDDQEQEPPASLTHKIMQNYHLDLTKRIKSNVSSIKSQLSERLSHTSKRASLLADHLLTSIKEDSRSLKDQLLVGGPVSSSSGDRRHAHSSLESVDSSNSADGQQQEKQPKSSSSTTSRTKPKSTNDKEDEKARLFSLIYLHQQQAGGGQPVITRQPTSLFAGKQTNIKALKTTSPSQASSSMEKADAEKMLSETKTTQCRITSSYETPEEPQESSAAGNRKAMGAAIENLTDHEQQEPKSRNAGEAELTNVVAAPPSRDASSRKNVRRTTRRRRTRRLRNRRLTRRPKIRGAQNSRRSSVSSSNDESAHSESSSSRAPSFVASDPGAANSTVNQGPRTIKSLTGVHQQQNRNLLSSW